MSPETARVTAAAEDRKSRPVEQACIIFAAKLRQLGGNGSKQRWGIRQKQGNEYDDIVGSFSCHERAEDFSRGPVLKNDRVIFAAGD